jgi:hypothetical protein
VLLLTGCGARAVSVAPSASARSSAGATATATAAASADASPTSTPLSVLCKTGVAASSLLLIGHHPATGSLLYEVSDPLHPRLLCRFRGTSAQVIDADSVAYLRSASSTETDVIRRSLSTGSESITARMAFAMPPDPWQSMSWRNDGSLVAYSIQPTESSPGSQVTVWLYGSGSATTLTTYPLPITDCICRFGLPDPASDLSPDGEYVVSGWPLGKGSEPFTVSRVAGRSRVASLDSSVISVLWDRTGHRLFLISPNGVQVWTPEAGITSLVGAKQWTFMPSLSADGRQAVYTTYVDDAQTQLRVFLYDFASATTRMLSNQSRSQVLFVKAGWVWYLDEPSCDQNQSGCGPWGTAPSGRVFAQELATGHEGEVTFAAGEAPITASDWGAFEAEDVWPAS